MRTFHIWERGVYQARDVDAEFMRHAVARFAGSTVRKLAGDASLSTPNNPVAWIADDGSGRQFTAYEIHQGGN
ncbi:MAG: hypothetical protein ABSE57_24770 [Bryobacteraceae bacterium]|jgi:hypothetical protein